jgi:predicted HicB family RNase H-like nuclease
MGAIEDAIAAIESLKPEEYFPYTKIAATYGCSHSALSKRHQGLTGSRSTVAENQQALHLQQEQELLQYIEQLTERGLPPTRAMIRRFGSNIAKRELGKCWVDRYIQRYNVHLISRWATGMDRLRHQADSQSKYSLYFELLRGKLS